MNIFLDCGAHCGCSRRKIQGLFGNKYQIYSFEPDPDFNRFCQFLINRAVWIQDTTIDFYKYRLSGASSVLPERSDFIQKHSPHEKVRVFPTRAFDLNRFMLEHFSEKDNIALKLDVEGAEYSILPHIIKGGAIKLVSKLYIEWHNKRVNVSEDVDRDLTKQIEGLGISIEIWDAMKSGYCIGNKN